MGNLAWAAVVIAAAIGFYAFLGDVVAHAQPEPVDVWHCDGWVGKKYPNEKSMKEAVN